MNKKILSLAVAAAFAAPMAAQADVAVNGAFGMGMWSTNESLAGSGGSASGGITGGDLGTSKLEINVKDGDAVAKVAFNLDNMLNTGAAPASNRELFGGVKLGGGTLTFGRLANAYAGTLKVDTHTADFLEARKNKGGVSKVSSFVSGLVGYAGSAGDVSYNVQYGPSDVDTTGASQNFIAAGVKFKAGGATIGVGYQGDNNSKTTTGIMAKMKFSDVSLGVSYENADGAYMAGGTAGTSENVIFADASMPMGNGTVGVGLGSNTDTKATFARLSYDMKMGAAQWTFGGRSADGDTRIGLALKVSY